MGGALIGSGVGLFLGLAFGGALPRAVAVDGDLYVRAYNGQDSQWYQAAVRQQAGPITAAGMTKEVTFEPVDGSVNDCIDDAYRAKYHDSPYLCPMIGPRARSATVKVMPRETIAEPS